MNSLIQIDVSLQVIGNWLQVLSQLSTEEKLSFLKEQTSQAFLSKLRFCNLLQTFKINSVGSEISMSYLHNEIPTTEVSNGARKPSAAPDEPQEEWPLCVRKGLHHLPEPLDEGWGWLYSLVGSHRLQQVERDVWASTHLRTWVLSKQLHPPNGGLCHPAQNARSLTIVSSS